ncbi:hypothetical protein FBUS_02406 [Fasciolopsis buskii]|uniref:Uncharacterized protein n=1 Tax=Fasciolopsis buskii TaxID=27845 RepID=A0A8E0VLD0_9TREM|nr:hypothetical protein FBUS_02406 [Fasciolopsis buski]
MLGQHLCWSGKLKTKLLNYTNDFGTISENASPSTTVRPTNFPVTQSAHAAAAVKGTRFVRPQSTRDSPFSPSVTRVQHSRCHLNQLVPHLEVCVQLQLVPFGNGSVSRPDFMDDSVSSYDGNFFTEFLSLEAHSGSWSTSRSHIAAGKGQAAKLKPLNARKMEFYLLELDHSVDHD